MPVHVLRGVVAAAVVCGTVCRGGGDIKGGGGCTGTGTFIVWGAPLDRACAGVGEDEEGCANRLP